MSSEKESPQLMTDIEVLVVESPRKGVMINGRYPVSKSLGRLTV